MAVRFAQQPWPPEQTPHRAAARPAAPPAPFDQAVFQDELTQSLSFALRFNGRKRLHSAGDVMAQITAERLVEYLERCRATSSYASRL